MRRFCVRMLLGALGGVLACSSTKVTKSWTNPAAQGAAFDKLLVVAMVRETRPRRQLEDRLVAELADRGVEAAPSYRYSEPGEPIDPNMLRRLEAREGFDGILVVRYVGTEVDVDYDPQFSTYEYIGGLRPAPFFRLTTRVEMETRLFSTEGPDQVLWSAASETWNPTDPAGMDEAIAQSVVDRLDREVRI